MIIITIDEIQRDVKSYLQRVKAGETLVILEANRPVAEIKPIIAHEDSLRPYALCAGEFHVPEDFDAPLPDEVIQQFEGR
ncbi:MAG: type II toxin-antitoxin system Phd/YefM family antitoxin [Candidatus Bipolaricaulota bacterium]|nr:type II toxin-antitoxin system Phd/YefM family antitoxin [Candidatus Bipolaricaulota bacterium]MCS7274453.1 type II toxin-antitoxin system Phd/YefM family antitoxin [Candidatus Bipolaricaulota bacterium]